jgi:hypothetical protein
MVALRDFVQKDGSSRLPWVLLPVRPMAQRFALTPGGAKVAVADKAWIGADVRPTDEDDDGPDGDFAAASSEEEADPLPSRVAKRAKGSGPSRDGLHGADGNDVGRAAGSDGGQGEVGMGGAPSAARLGGGGVQCDRCGESGHSGAQCSTHARPRGAGHCASVPRRHSGLSLSRGLEGYRVHKSSSVITKMPGDGGCLFHAMTAGLAKLNRRPGNPSATRAEIADWLVQNARTLVHGVQLKDWIKWDSDRQWTVARYAALVRGQGFWGGEIEMVACSMNSGVNVVVWVEVEGDHYLRIAAYLHGLEGRGVDTVHLLYVAGMHYDLLVPRFRMLAGGGRGIIGG